MLSGPVRAIHSDAAAQSRQPRQPRQPRAPRTKSTPHPTASTSEPSQSAPLVPPEPVSDLSSEHPDGARAGSTPSSPRSPSAAPSGSPGSAPVPQQPRRDRLSFFEEDYLLDPLRDVRKSNVSEPEIKARLRHYNLPTPKLQHRVQYNRDPFSLHPREDHFSYPSVTADNLAGDKQRPRGVRMLARDFVHDALYNPFYGYFSRQAVLLPHFSDAQVEQNDVLQGRKNAPTLTYKRAMERLGPLVGDKGEFKFNDIKGDAAFTNAVASRYQAFEDRVEQLDTVRTVEVVKRRKEVLERQLKEKNLPSKEVDKRLKDLELTYEASKYKTALQFVRSKGVRPESGKGLDLAQAWGRASQLKSQSDELEEPDVMAMAARQVWHTPTELFKPYFSEAVARYLVNEYKMGLYPYEDLVIYEIGAGSGALAEGILTYLREREPQVYSRTRYGIIEISSRLSKQQKIRLKSFIADGRVEVHKKDVLQWGQPVQEPCFVIALEVFDNLAHDVVRWDTANLQPYQGVVSIDETGDYEELWEPVQDPAIKRYLRLLEELQVHSGNSLTPLPLARSALPWYARYLPPKTRAYLAKEVPLWPNLTEPMYIPTAALRLLDNLKRFFPQHRLVMSDFNYLPDTIGGTNAPVVQTRLKGTSVAVTKYTVMQGFFDIFYPTDFEVLKAVYMRVMADQPGAGGAPADNYLNSFSNAFYYSSATGRSPMHRAEPRILSQAAFLSAHADVAKTRLSDGTNPMLSWYRNVSWFLT